MVSYTAMDKQVFPSWEQNAGTKKDANKRLFSNIGTEDGT